MCIQYAFTIRLPTVFGYNDTLFFCGVGMMEDSDLNTRLNKETARIAWKDLQSHFARGVAVYVAPELDLIDVAKHFAADEATKIQSLMSDQRVALVSEAQAGEWAEADQEMWAVVVLPWVLVQPVAG